MRRAFCLSVLSLLPVGPAWFADDVAKSGADLYRRFCASCHGLDGRSDGPVAASFSARLADVSVKLQRPTGD
jgi:mono/diheme cytochrome c family protein